jgi:hypothetical protein
LISIFLRRKHRDSQRSKLGKTELRESILFRAMANYICHRGCSYQRRGIFETSKFCLLSENLHPSNLPIIIAVMLTVVKVAVFQEKGSFFTFLGEVLRTPSLRASPTALLPSGAMLGGARGILGLHSTTMPFDYVDIHIPQGSYPYFILLNH